MLDNSKKSLVLEKTEEPGGVGREGRGEVAATSISRPMDWYFHISNVKGGPPTKSILNSLYKYDPA